MHMTQLKKLRSIGTLCIPVATVLSGCASSPPVEPADVAVAGGRAKFQLPGEIFGSLTNDAVMHQYARALNEASKYRPVFNDNGTLKGVEAMPQADGVALSYLKHATSTMYHNYRAKFDVKLTRAGSDVVAEVSCPTSMKVEYRPGPMGLSWPPLIQRPAAVADLTAMCGTAFFKGSKRETGEVNVNFPDASVYANFARKLRPASAYWRETAPVSKDDLAKFKWFELPDGKITRVVGITVFPYRAGSKVTFKWDNEAVCRPNVPCQYDSAAPPRVQGLVASIAND